MLQASIPMEIAGSAETGTAIVKYEISRSAETARTNAAVMATTPCFGPEVCYSITSGSREALEAMRGAIRRPFFVGRGVQHILGFVQLLGLLGRGTGRAPVPARAEQQEEAQSGGLHLGEVPLCPKIKKGPPVRAALSLS